MIIIMMKKGIQLDNNYADMKKGIIYDNNYADMKEGIRYPV